LFLAKSRPQGEAGMNPSNAESPASPASAAVLVSAALPDAIATRLRAATSVLEIGCGHGLGCLAMAEAFPMLSIAGHDGDAAAIARARALALSAGLDHRVRFEVSDSLRLPRHSADLVVVSGARGRPDAARLLNAIRNALSTEGACLLVERAPPRTFPGRASARAADEALRAAAEQAGFSRFRRLRSSDRGVEIFELGR
jgi:SAM-dependent methyltransferase